MNILIVMYHYVHDEESAPFKGLHAVSTDRFCAQMEHLLVERESVSPKQLEKALAEGSPLPERGFMPSFDDGLRDHWNYVVPILDKFGIKGLFAPMAQPYLSREPILVNVNQIVRGRLGEEGLMAAYREGCAERFPGIDLDGVLAAVPADVPYHAGNPSTLRLKYALNHLIPRSVTEAVVFGLYSEIFGEGIGDLVSRLYLDEGEIREIHRMGHRLACHTVSHRSLTALSRGDKVDEIATSRDWLHGLVGAGAMEWISYPYGEFDDEVIAVSKELGFAFGYSARGGEVRTLASPLALPRLDCNAL